LSPRYGEATTPALLEHPRTGTSLIGRRVGAASLVRARLTLRRHRERTDGGQ
jgi:hypothetical protein